jgi:phosphatidylinositol alpha 1,6-mannosyltransferase
MTTYVALGDSFTSGLAEGESRWPDQVARSLGEAVRYENLAWAGATSEDVERVQLVRALSLEPDLVTLICGANDVLESVRPDESAYAERLARMWARLRSERPSAVLLTATYPDISRFVDLRPRTRARVQRSMRSFNSACRRAASRYGVALLEGFDPPAADDRSTYAADGFHPSPEGHRAAAAAFVRTLRSRFST